MRLREGVVAAGVEDDEVDRLLVALAQPRQQLVDRHRLGRYVECVADARIDRDQVVLAVNLQAVAGVVEERDAVMLAHPADEVGEGARQRAPAQVGPLGDREA